MRERGALDPRQLGLAPRRQGGHGSGRSLPTKKRISIVFPVLNEEKNIRALYEAVDEEIGRSHEIELIFVDDGSLDSTGAVVKDLIRRDPRVRLIALSRTFGHQAALLAGMENASGEAIVTMDADLQHPPCCLPRMIEAWEEGADVVTMVREHNLSRSLGDRFLTWAQYAVLRSILSVELHANAADFRLLSRRACDRLVALPERNLFFRGMVPWIGYRQVMLTYEAADRRSGTSSFSFWKRIQLAVTGMSAFSAVPLRIALVLGGVFAALSALLILWVLVGWLFLDRNVRGYSSLMIFISVASALQLLSIGLLGEYVHRIYEEVKGRPRYVILEQDGFPPSPPSTGRG